MYVCKRCYNLEYKGTETGRGHSSKFRRCDGCGKMIRPGQIVYVV